MRLPAALLLSLLCSTVSTAARAGDDVSSDGVRRDRQASLRRIGERMQALARRIDAVLIAARRDPDDVRVEIYRAYSAKALKNRRRSVRAEDLLRIMVDPGKAAALRQKARDALAEGSPRGDIELSPTHERGGMTERALFCRFEVVEHLRSDDLQARRMTYSLLDQWYRVRGLAAVLAYKVDDPRTWSRAVAAWKKALKRL